MSRAFFVQLRREFAALLLSPIAWIVFVCMSFMLALCFYMAVKWVAQGTRNVPVLLLVYMNVCFWFVFLVTLPLLTMRSFSEEYKSGTIEPLLTAPITDLDVVMAKFFAITGIFAISMSSPFINLAFFQYISQGKLPVEWGTLGLTALILLVIGGFYVSIGLFASSLTRNQIVAAILSFTFIIVIFFIGVLGFMVPDSVYKQALDYVFPYTQVDTYARGIFDSRPLVYNLTGTVLFLALTKLVMASRKLRG